MRLLPILYCIFLTTLICQAVPPQAPSEGIDFYRFQLGDFQITALLDSTKPMFFATRTSRTSGSTRSKSGRRLSL